MILIITSYSITLFSNIHYSSKVFLTVPCMEGIVFQSSVTLIVSEFCLLLNSETGSKIGF